MARINLLPWRETLRRQRKRDFGLLALGAALVTLLGMGYWHWYNEDLIDFQNKRNAYLKREIAEVDKAIAEIKNLERTRAQLIARMNVIQDLQTSRPLEVHLFDELVNTLPDGIYLSEVVQGGAGVSLTGRAQSNARVSTYMRNIDASPWLSGPQLEVIEQKDKTPASRSLFKLRAKQVIPKKEGGR